MSPNGRTDVRPFVFSASAIIAQKLTLVPISILGCPKMDREVVKMSPRAYWTIHWFRLVLWPLPVLTLIRADCRSRDVARGWAADNSKRKAARFRGRARRTK